MASLRRLINIITVVHNARMTGCEKCRGALDMMLLRTARIQSVIVSLEDYFEAKRLLNYIHEQFA